MRIGYRVTPGFVRKAPRRLLLALLTLMFLPGTIALAQQDRVLEQEVDREAALDEPVVAEEQNGEGTERVAEPEEGRTHATVEAPVELITMAGREPEKFIGKTLLLTDVVNKVIVGPVLEVRRRKLDQDYYLIVDATRYFNAPTKYAVAVKDIARLEADNVMMPESAGMHLRGLEYYAEDYTDIVQPPPPFISPDD